MEAITLEPVDSVAVTTVVDNFFDVLMVDQGPAKRPLGYFFPPSPPRRAAATLDGGSTFDLPIAEHGFSALVTVRKGTENTASCSMPG